VLGRVLAGVLALPFLLGTAAAPSHPGRVEFTFTDPEIVESSGLVVSDGLFVTTNDSGDSGRVFAVDPATGGTVGVTRWSEDPEDVEALAPAGRDAVWVGDIGDNSADRDGIRVARVPVGLGDATVDPPTFELTYPGGPTNAESLLTDPATGRLYVATKDVFGGRLYAAPARLSATTPNRLRPVGPVLPIATDGAFFPDGKHLVLRDYSRAVVYSFPALEEVGSFRLPDQDQGEGIAVAADGAVFVSSEGQREPVLRVPLPQEVRRALDPPAPAPDASATPSQPPRPTATVDPQAPSFDPADRPAWPWFLTGWVAVGGLVLLARWLGKRRPRS
jgi:hypothetical protein